MQAARGNARCTKVGRKRARAKFEVRVDKKFEEDIRKGEERQERKKKRAEINQEYVLLLQKLKRFTTEAECNKASRAELHSQIRARVLDPGSLA